MASPVVDLACADTADAAKATALDILQKAGCRQIVIPEGPVHAPETLVRLAIGQWMLGSESHSLVLLGQPMWACNYHYEPSSPFIVEARPSPAVKTFAPEYPLLRRRIFNLVLFDTLEHIDGSHYAFHPSWESGHFACAAKAELIRPDELSLHYKTFASLLASGPDDAAPVLTPPTDSHRPSAP